jgi:Ni,Fe-hydrogenase I large subunit
LEEKITMAAPYKTGPQARFLIDKMTESEKNI